MGGACVRFSKEVSVAAGAQFDGTELRLFPVGTEPNVQFRCAELNLRMGAESQTYPIVTLPAPYVDERGIIQNITTSGAQSVALLTSKSGSSRASHVHRSDDHLAWVVSGCIEYWWRDVMILDGKVVSAEMSEVRSVIVEAGQAFYTPRHVAHTMFFPVDTTFLTISCKARTHEEHEADLIRVPSLKPDEAE